MKSLLNDKGIFNTKKIKKKIKEKQEQQMKTDEWITFKCYLYNFIMQNFRKYGIIYAFSTILVSCFIKVFIHRMRNKT